MDLDECVSTITYVLCRFDLVQQLLGSCHEILSSDSSLVKCGVVV